MLSERYIFIIFYYFLDINLFFRLANFVIQYIESPIVGTSQWSAKKGSKLYQNETVARRQCQKEIAQLHQYFATSLRRAQVKSRTIAVGIKKKKQSFIDKDEAKSIKKYVKVSQT